MNLLCFDISSGGITAALFNSKLEAVRVAESRWILETDKQGTAATLSLELVIEQFKQAIRGLNLTGNDAIDAICIGTFMHSCVVLGDADQPLTPVFTWLDRRGESALDYIRARLGDRFHQITGCRYHPMFPVFKLAAMRMDDPEILRRAARIVSVKALLINRLTAGWFEDYGMASATGLFDVARGDWSGEVLEILGFDRASLPQIARRTETVGIVTRKASVDFGLPESVPVVVGSGDGFFANMGSDCEVPSRIAVTLGTSAVVRQTLNRAVVDKDAGTFCYRADEDAYLLGCAGSNGGNVLDWGRLILAKSQSTEASEEPPIFIPLLNGERSPEWNPHLKGAWHGLTAQHTSGDLWRSIMEGVIFNLAHFVEIVQSTSGEKATDLILSGNGFLTPMTAPILAGVAGMSTWMPREPGLASLRGAGICALRALGQPTPGLNPDVVSPLMDKRVLGRYSEYRRLRSAVS